MEVYVVSILFIGLGNMGFPMAKNLLDKGIQVIGSDYSEKVMNDFRSLGANTWSNGEKLPGVDVVITMLPNSSIVKDLYLGETGILKQLKKDSLLIDCSSIDASTTREIAEASKNLGINMVDAPVSGGIMAAQAGTLTFMVGGDTQSYERASAFLEKMGKNIFYAGDHGAGQIAKACNNMLLAINMIGTCEALNLAQLNGLDPKIISQIIQNSSGNNWCVNTYNPIPDVLPNAPSSNGYTAGFMTELMLKDLGLSMNAAAESNATVYMGALAKNIFLQHALQGYGKADFSSVFNLISGH